MWFCQGCQVGKPSRELVNPWIQPFCMHCLIPSFERQWFGRGEQCNGAARSSLLPPSIRQLLIPGKSAINYHGRQKDGKYLNSWLEQNMWLWQHMELSGSLLVIAACRRCSNHGWSPDPGSQQTPLRPPFQGPSGPLLAVSRHSTLTWAVLKLNHRELR